MISFAAPAWLIALAAVPLLWWLHRARGHGALLRVSSLLHWREAARHGGTSTLARRADPAWLRRALTVAALTFALAEPVLDRPAREIVLWLDDSLSMSARERQGTRVALALAEARRLAAAREARLTVRPLAHGTAAAAGFAEVQPPPRAALDADQEHWLASDGTSDALARWVAEAPVSRVIGVGTATENVGLTALAARPSLEIAGSLDVQLEVFNAGLAPASRRLTVRAGTEPVLVRELRIAAGGTVLIDLRMRADAGALEARLEPADALAGDDALGLAAEEIRPRRLAADASCPARLRRALAAHPMLALVPAAASADLAIGCGDPGMLHFVTPGANRTLEVAAADLARQSDAAYPLNVAAKLDEAFGVPLLERVARVARPPDGSRIARKGNGGETRRIAAPLGTRTTALAGWLALLAALFLGWDLVATARSMRLAARFERGCGRSEP